MVVVEAACTRYFANHGSCRRGEVVELLFGHSGLELEQDWVLSAMLTSAPCTRTNVIDRHFGGWFGAQDLPKYHVGKGSKTGHTCIGILGTGPCCTPPPKHFPLPTKKFTPSNNTWDKSHFDCCDSDAAGILDFDYVLIEILMKDERKLRRRS